MDLQKTLTNAGRTLIPGVDVIYNTFKDTQDRHNNERVNGHYKGKTSINVPDLYSKGLQNQIDALNRDTSRWNEDYAYYNDLVNKGLADSSETAYRNEAYAAIQNNNQRVRELEGEKLANNEALFNMAANIPTVAPITMVNRRETVGDLINQQVDLMAGEKAAQLEGRKARNAQSYIDAYRAANDGANDKLWNRNMEVLESLGVSMDDIRAEYFRRYPTPQMEARDRAGEALNNAFYNALGPSPVQTTAQSQVINNDAQMQEAKKLIVNELSRMNSTGETQTNPTRTQRLINLYNKLK